MLCYERKLQSESKCTEGWRSRLSPTGSHQPPICCFLYWKTSVSARRSYKIEDLSMRVEVWRTSKQKASVKTMSEQRSEEPPK